LVQDLGGTYHTGAVKNLNFCPDIIIECTGVASIIIDAMNRLGNDSILCLVGVSSHNEPETIDIGTINRAMVLENSVIFGSVNANRRHYEMAEKALCKADRNWLSRMITRKEPLSNWQEALKREPGDIKVVIQFAAAWDTTDPGICLAMTQLIEDYALIGNNATAALVGRNGSIDWLSFPRFDSGACFAGLLGSHENGHWTIEPKAERPTIHRRYRDGTLVLETEFSTP
jgi:hypothetical protein